VWLACHKSTVLLIKLIIVSAYCFSDVFHGNINILRCFVSGNISLLVRAFLVYVRPVLEYNSVVWSPHLIQDIIRIEKIQTHFTKRLRGFRNLSYADQLTKLDLPSLELRRLQPDLIYCYKLVFGLVKLNTGDFFEFSSVSNTRGHAYKLYKPRCSKVQSIFLFL